MSGSESVRWPADRFYWAVLDASLLPRAARRDPERLGYLFEPLVPCELEDLHAVYVPGADGRVVACAAERAALDETVEGGATALGPDAVPDCVDATLDPAAINLLTGEYEPEAARSLRRTANRALLLSSVAALLVLSLGFERRADALADQAATVRASELALATEVLGSDASRSALPISLQIESELRSLRRTRSSDVPIDRLPDASLELSGLLSLWPGDLHVETDSIHVTPESIHVQSRVGTTDDAQTLASTLSTLEGWTSGTPTIRARSGEVRTSVQLRREERE